MNKSFIGSLWLHFAALLFGGSFISQKILVNANIPLFYMIAMRFACVIFIIFLLKKNLFTPKTISRGCILGLLLIVGIYCQNFGLHGLDASVSAFVTGVSITLIPVLNFLVFRTRVSKYNIIAVLFVMTGVNIFNQITAAPTDAPFNLYMISTMIGSLAFAFHIIFTNYFLERDESPINMHIIQCIVTGVLAVIGGLLFETFPTGIWTPSTIIAIVYLGVFTSIIAYGAQTYGQHLTQDPVKAGLIISLEPIWTFILSIPILGEVVSSGKLLGMLFVCIGIVCCEWENIKKMQSSQQDT